MTKQLPNWKFANTSELRNFAKVRIVATDVDGTLESRSLSVYENIGKHLYTLRRGPASIDFLIATGRTMSGVSRLARQLKLGRGTPSILYNGSLVVDSGNLCPLMHKRIPNGFLLDLLRSVDLSQVCIFAYFFGDSIDRFVLDAGTGKESVIGWSKTHNAQYEFNGMPISWRNTDDQLIDGDPTAILIQSQSGLFEVGLLDFIQADSRVSLTTSGGQFLEIRPQGSNKGVALDFTCKHLGFDKLQTIALGDNDNDVEMLEWAGIGIAVANASSRAINAADYVCNHGVAECVVEVLRLISHARRFYLKGNDQA